MTKELNKTIASDVFKNGFIPPPHFKRFAQTIFFNIQNPTASIKDNLFCDRVFGLHMKNKVYTCVFILSQSEYWENV